MSDTTWPTTVSVIVPAKDAAASLVDAVTSALDQDVPGALELILAVGPSTDDTEHVAEILAAGDSRVRLVPNPTGTTPAGLNAALHACTGEVVVRVDAHARLPAGYVRRAIRWFDDPAVGNVGGRQVPTADSGFAAAVAAAMSSPLGTGGAAYRSGTRPGPVETVYLGVFRREALDEVGAFDERLLRNQDYELNHRLRRAGWTVWLDPSLAVAYRPRESVRALARQYFDYGRFKRVVMREHPASIRPRQLAPLLMVSAVAVSIVLGVWVSPMVPLVVVGGYLTGVVVGALWADPRRCPLVAVALAVIHWSWSAGLILGHRAAHRSGSAKPSVGR